MVRVTFDEEQSPPVRLLQRIGNPLNWCAADKCILVPLIVLTTLALYTAVAFYHLRHPDAAPYVQRSFIQDFALPFIWAYVATCVIIISTALCLRWRWPNNRPLVYATIFNYAIGSILIPSYIFGAFTNPYSVTVLLALAAVGLVLFEKQVIFFGLVFSVLGMLGITVAHQAGLIPYAPLFVGSPVEDAQLSNAWLAGFGGVTFGIALGVVGLIYYIIDRWHDREDKLVRTSEQLARATDVISRYVAAQVSEKILAGHYDAVDRHERRKLTLFFSDIKGFGSLADRIEPEDLSRLLNEYLSEMTTIAERHGATIDKFVGDAIMVFFGAPTATDDRDHALRAVRMAMEMQGQMQTLQQKWLREGIEEPFEIRIGLNTGVASVGNFGSQGRMDYTAIGRQVNLAARLQASCQPGKILLSHSTWVLVEDEIECVAKGEIQVKGVHHPVRVYEVMERSQSN